MAVARAAGHPLVRINLSDQTDLADLMGSDLPTPDTDNHTSSADGGDDEGGQGGGGEGGEGEGGGGEGGEASPRKAGGGGPRFAWRDGAFLSALRAGHWVLLDELNLGECVGPKINI